MQQRTTLVENVIEKNIKEWLLKNQKTLYALRGDREMTNKTDVSRKFLHFMNEAPKYKLYLRQIGIIDEGLTDSGYIYLRRIAENIPLSLLQQ